jgi:hypothetical protein
VSPAALEAMCAEHECVDELLTALTALAAAEEAAAAAAGKGGAAAGAKRA